MARSVDKGTRPRTTVLDGRPPRPDLYQRCELPELIEKSNDKLGWEASELRDELNRFRDSLLRLISSVGNQVDNIRVINECERLWNWCDSHESFKLAWEPFSKGDALTLRGPFVFLTEIEEQLRMPPKQLAFLEAAASGFLAALEQVHRQAKPVAPSNGVVESMRSLIGEMNKGEKKKGERNREPFSSDTLLLHLEAIISNHVAGTPGRPRLPKRVVGEAIGRAMLFSFEFNREGRSFLPRSVKKLMALCGQGQPREVTKWLDDLTRQRA